MGAPLYRDADRLLVTADAGGSKELGNNYLNNWHDNRYGYIV
jgi:hypothetical protein